MPTRSPVAWLARWADWFELRGVYVPGEDNQTAGPWREYRWLIVAWLVGCGVFLLVFAVAV